MIYDTHELETETSTSEGIRKRVAKRVEKFLIGFADEVITVTDSIGKWYEKEYDLKDVAVVRNTPLRPDSAVEKSPALKKTLGVPADAQLFIYQGGLGLERGIEMLLEVFAKLDDKHVVFVGFGPLADKVKEYAACHGNIHFHEAVPTHELAAITSGADVGLALLENTSLNHYYCLGNKVFEYLLCGLPVIVSDFPEMGRIISENQCGWRVDVDKEQLVADLISGITDAEIRNASQRARQCRMDLVWENEEPGLLQVYDRLSA